MIYDPKLVTPEGEAAFAELRKVARKRRKDTQAVVTRFALERVVARLFEGPHRDRFVMKGGMVFMFAEGADPVDARSTADIDLHLPSFDGPIEELRAIVRETLEADPSEMGGVSYDVDGLVVEEKREGPVAGGSATFSAQVGQVRVKLKMDVGFDRRPAHDVAETVEMPSVLPHLHAPFPVRKIPFSWTLADKVQALIRHGERTTRFRDYYDIHVLLSKGLVDPEQAADAMVRTFDLFGTDLPDDVDGFGALSEAFVQRNAQAWVKECRSRGFFVPVPDLRQVVGDIRAGVEPILARANEMARGPRP